MLLIKGSINDEITNWKDVFITLLSSVDMKKEALLLLLDHYSLKGIDLKKFNTINRLKGASKDLLTDKYKLIEWFMKIKFHGNLPAIVLPSFHQKDVEAFLKRGTKHKFLKPSDGFAGAGIHVIDSVEEVKQAMEAKESSKKPFSGWVLQDALEDIATFQGYKFHLRVTIVVVVQDRRVCVFIGNFHSYGISPDLYNITQLKNKRIYNTHNTKQHFFPMDAPDRWTSDDCKKAMHQINQDFKFIFKQKHTFFPDWNIKNGYELLGADVIFDTKHRSYILEINSRPAYELEHLCFYPELLHIGLGGAPLKLFSTLYGTPKGRITPFIKPLSTFYETIYKTASDVNNEFKTLFHVSLEKKSDRAYFEYQKMSKPKNRTLRAKSKLTGSKTLKRGSKK
jgi:hypothetical protein